MSTPTPLILCGAKKHMANLIKTKLLPEYNVIYAGYNPIHSKREVPLIISGNPPAYDSLHMKLASNDFTSPARAIVTGGGYSEEGFQELYQACVKACGSRENLSVPFFRASNEITDRLADQGMGPAHSSVEYPDAITERLKRRLKEVGIADEVVNKGELGPGGIGGL
ncbi:uncharacterized protein N7496_002238 [Penicillium cataractarum]|uniref:Uncharacterized protein n=1 Tax=Penicillium cataractarum TaxID=2100454 RepID=A0A9W9VHN3_9EURO|nr:uncharacterized protein N7496_002238 [Penicillium cataractarum]KAJ5379810.1 hypothetical protein N7496_002238 [Penicillium cataractarum]